MNAVESRYLAPGAAEHRFSKALGVLSRWGFTMWGSRQLEVRGRVSGEWRTTMVNLLHYDGQRYLVAPRGNAQWVRNLRAAGTGRLRAGRRVIAFVATELPDETKPPVLREYLRKWWFEIGRFFPGLSKNPTDEELVAISPGYPVFRIDERK